MSTDDLENPSTRTETAKDLYHPEGAGTVDTTTGDGPLSPGLPNEPSSRAAGREGRATGVPSDGNFSQQDISTDAKKTLGDWLDLYTKNNTFSTQVFSNDSQATPVVEELPNKYQLDFPDYYTYGGDPDGTSPGVPDTGGEGHSYLRNVGNNEGFSNNETKLGSYQNPNEEQTTTKVGNVSGDDGILSRNRFRGKQPFVNGAGVSSRNRWANTQKTKESGSTLSKAVTLGKYDKNAQGLSMEQIQNVAEQLLFNAVGDVKTEFTNKNSKNRGDAILGTGAGFPGQQVTGAGHSLIPKKILNADTDFRVAEAIPAAVAGDRTKAQNINGQMSAVLGLPEEDLAANEPYRRKSYGVLNNHLEPFSSALPTAMIVLAVIAAITALIASVVIALIFDVLGIVLTLGRGNLAPAPTYQDSTSRGSAHMPKGKAFGESGFSYTNMLDQLGEFLGLKPLDYDPDSTLFPFTRAALFGSLEFFIGNVFKGNFPQILTTSAGFYVVVVRNAIRDIDQVTRAASEMGGGGILGAIEGFFVLIDAFKTSATFKLMRTLIQLGDRVMMSGGMFGPRVNAGIGGMNQVPPENQDRSKFIEDLGKTIRLNSSNPKLSYSFSSLPQVFVGPLETNGGLFPNTPTGDTRQNPAETMEVVGITAGLNQEDAIFKYAAAVNGGAEGVLRTTNAISVTSNNLYNDQKLKPSEVFPNSLVYMNADGTIPTQFRQQMEEYLEAYYVPFYFHDLRTNEILPMPCFVSNFTDTYSPKINSVTGMGRMDAVQIYESTSRKIGLSFYMVATNEEDYGQLWYGINKLVSMVYPKWSAGKQVANHLGYQFSKPYSSIPTASPMIRLRVGELFASNRSLETIRRSFGAGLPGTRIKPPAEDSFDGSVPAGIGAALKKMAENTFPKVDPSAYDLILATNLANPSGKIGFVNLAGGKINPEEGTVTGGATDIHGKSVLMPAGTIIRCARPRFEKFHGVKWNGMKWDRKKAVNFNNDYMVSIFGKIINYAILERKAKTKESDSGPSEGNEGSTYMSNQVYYVVEPVGFGPWQSMDTLNGSDRKKSQCIGLLIPIQNARIDYASPEAGPAGTLDEKQKLFYDNHLQLALPPIPIPPFPPPGDPPPGPPPHETDFYNNNSILDAQYTSGGRGLAGFITSLDFDWNEAPWETNAQLGRAPQWCKVSMGFAPIHDEPLGLSWDGSMRAPAYPVGHVVEQVFGPRFSDPSLNWHLATIRMASIASAVAMHMSDSNLVNNSSDEADPASAESDIGG